MFLDVAPAHPPARPATPPLPHPLSSSCPDLAGLERAVLFPATEPLHKLFFDEGHLSSLPYVTTPTPLCTACQSQFPGTSLVYPVFLICSTCHPCHFLLENSTPPLDCKLQEGKEPLPIQLVQSQHPINLSGSKFQGPQILAQPLVCCVV